MTNKKKTEINVRKVSEEARKNSAFNITYLIDECIMPSFKLSTYKANETFSGLAISPVTLKNARSGKAISVKTLRMMASSFSLYLWNSVDRIKEEDLTLSPETFKKKFPVSAFISDGNSEILSIELFANKLYRGYYMLPNSSDKVYMCYFELFYKDGNYSAAMLRGIQDFQDTENFQSKFESVKIVKEYFEKVRDKFKSQKRTSTIHLYTSCEERPIIPTTHCIKIDFASYESKPCYCTMYWNIDIPNRVKPDPYSGGIALMVDTNDGGRGKSISSYKLAIESIKDTNKIPLNNYSPYLIEELKPEIRNNVLILDNAQDSHWHNFMYDVNRKASVKEEIDLSKLAHRLLSLENKYSKQLSRLEELLDTMESNKKVE